MRKGDIKRYRSTTLIIVDAPDDSIEHGPDHVETKHESCCRLMEDFFTDLTNAEIVKICLPAGSNENTFTQTVHELLADKTNEDLLIVYYHGNAGGEEQEYTWYVGLHPFDYFPRC